uniref:Aquaporin 7 n=1 Tax=Oryctolagus cuniculus TaxID=9986 RepID=A0A5F9C818_RABIT
MVPAEHLAEGAGSRQGWDCDLSLGTVPEEVTVGLSEHLNTWKTKHGSSRQAEAVPLQLPDGLLACASADPRSPAEGDGARVPGRVPEHVRHDGAHMNAAVSFTACALGRMSWKKFPVYVLGQFLGSFTAAATIYGLFYTAILHFSGGHLAVTGPTATANIFATYLPDHMTLWWGFLNEVVLTGMLQLCLLAITDKENNPALPGTQALVTGILVVIIGASLGMNTGYAINPSRDLPPRFFTFIAGWGKQVFRAGENWWWVPVVAPIVGAYLGGIVYLVFIGSGIPREPQESEDSAMNEEHRITTLSKTSAHLSVTSHLDPVSRVPANTSSVQPVPPVNGSILLESF